MSPTITHTDEGVAVLLEVIPTSLRRVLDLGTGDGGLLATVLGVRPEAHGVGFDFSPPMLALAEERFEGNRRATIIAHHLANPLPMDRKFYDALGIEEGAPSNRLVAVETSLNWMRDAGLDDVDCLWKWREMVLLTGHTPG